MFFLDRGKHTYQLSRGNIFLNISHTNFPPICFLFSFLMHCFVHLYLNYHIGATTSKSIALWRVLIVFCFLKFKNKTNLFLFRSKNVTNPFRQKTWYTHTHVGQFFFIVLQRKYLELMKRWKFSIDLWHSLDLHF